MRHGGEFNETIVPRTEFGIGPRTGCAKVVHETGERDGRSIRRVGAAHGDGFGEFDQAAGVLPAVERANLVFTKQQADDGGG